MATFSLIIPVYNEERTVADVLEKLLNLSFVDQLVVVNDGSRDKTDQVLKTFLQKENSRLRVVTHQENRGKGAAIRSGISVVSTDYAVIQDADLEYDPADLTEIFKRVTEYGVDAVFGSRFLKKNPKIYNRYYWGNQWLTWFINRVGNGRLTDAYTCYKAMSMDRWRKLDLDSDGFEIEAEIATKMLVRRWNIVEVPINYNPRSHQQGKKIRPVHALGGMLKALQCKQS